MKKLLTIATLCGLASASFGQGFVATGNTATSKVSTGVNGTNTTIAAANLANYDWEVLVAPTTLTTVGASLAGWTDTLDTLVSAGANGRLIPGNNTPDSTGQAIPGYGPTATADFVVVGWSANLGSYANALAWWNNGSPTVTATEYFGISGVATSIPLAPSGGPYNSIWGLASSGQIAGLALNQYTTVTPEPTTFALAGLGAAAVVIFRRRK
jgi:hypothetical protein